MQQRTPQHTPPRPQPPVQQRAQPSVQRTQPQAQQNQQRVQLQQRNLQSSQERMRQQAISNAQNQTRQRLQQQALTRNLPQNSDCVSQRETVRRQETLNQFERLKKTASSPQQRAIYARAFTAQKAYLNKPAPVYTHTVELKGRANIDKFVAELRSRKAQAVETQRTQPRNNTSGVGGADVTKRIDHSGELDVSANAARRHLRRNLEPGDGQAHHIISWESRNHPLVLKAAKGGFNINGAENGIRLGSDQHLGSHPKYNNAIISKLERLHQANPNMTPSEAASAVNSYISKLRAGLNRGSNKLR